MLVLGREAGETIVIGPDIAIYIVRTNSGHSGRGVKIGIIAPPHVPVGRTSLPLAQVQKLAAEGQLGTTKPPVSPPV
jgi:carbon storage regulator CsrA